MKTTPIQSIQLPKLKQKLKQALVMGRTFAILAICSMILFVMLGLGTMLQREWTASSSFSMKGIAASVSSRFFLDMLGMEVPYLATQHEESALSKQKLSVFLFQLLTNVNPIDPRSMLAHELPVLSAETAVPLRTAIGNEGMTAPADYNTVSVPTIPSNSESSESSENSENSNPVTPAPNVDLPAPAPVEVSTDVLPAQPVTPAEKEPAIQAFSGKKVVFVYHSHNQESWNPELAKKSPEPNSHTKNITLVGQRLTEKLGELGVGAAHSNTDYSTTVKSYSWNYSYKYSRETVKAAMADNNDLQYFFDIHRDSNARPKTTVTIDKKDYAQVFFIIGQGNKNWRKNEELANAIHSKLEKEYPGISRGVWGKSSANGNGEYNQSLSPNSILIEVGGIDNTLEECYRTADVLAKIIAEEVLQAEQVNAKTAAH